MTNEFRGIRDDDESHTHSLTTQTYRFASTSTSSSSSRSFNARVARPVRSRSRPRSFARPPSRCQTVVPRGGSIADRNSTRSNPTSRSVGNRTDVEPNRTDVEPNRTEPTSNRTRRTLGGGVSRSRARRTRHARTIRAFSHSCTRRRERPGRRVHRFASDGRVVCYTTRDDTCRVVIGELCDSRLHRDGMPRPGRIGATRSVGRSRRVVSSMGRDSPSRPPAPNLPVILSFRREGRSSTALGRRVDEGDEGRPSTTRAVGEGAVRARGSARGGGVVRSRGVAARDARATVEEEEEGARRRIRFVRSVEGGRREGRKEGRRGGT